MGAGVMGSAIAAHLSGAGVYVHLLDIVPPNLQKEELDNPSARNRFADTGLERALNAKPALFFDPDSRELIRTGNLEDHLERLRECQLIIEAVVENLDVKRKLFERLVPHISENAILASNTSGLSIRSMSGVLPDELQRRFIVMHFFNPVRYMRLLEVAPGPKTAAEVVEKIARFGEFLGKGIVYAKDTPNFIANRIGVYSLMLTMHEMQGHGLSIEAVDKIVGPALGRPKSAAFGTADIVGIDTFAHVAKHCYEALTGDEERDVFKVPEFVEKLVRDGRLGRKSGAGFYKKVGADILVFDPRTAEYRSQEKVRFDSLAVAKNEDDVKKRIKGVVFADDAAGRFAWKVVAKSLCYAANRLGEIADDIVNIDRAMRWGFNWELGPFETWDAIGLAESVSRMQADGIAVPSWVTQMLGTGQTRFYEGTSARPTYHDVSSRAQKSVAIDEQTLRLDALKPQGVVKTNLGASLVDLGDGVLCLEVHTKMNTLDADAIEMIEAARDEAQKNFEALVIGNDGQHFGAGANLFMILASAQQNQWKTIEDIIKRLQDAVQALRYAKVPVVSAPFGYTLGGGAEVAMAADASQAHAETYIGLVEVGVGLVPAGGGCLRMVERYTDDVRNVPGVDLLPFVGQASLNIATAKAATSAAEGKKLRYLRADDGISLNRDHLLFHAKARALGLCRSGYRPPLPSKHTAAGFDASRTIGMRIWGMVEAGFATDHDALIANKIAHILCGGAVAAGSVVSDQHYLDLEREAILSLCGEPKSQERMKHMLMYGKPLRN
jgi:3-hydroxyacyl-CoA dehydrogenase